MKKQAARENVIFDLSVKDIFGFVFYLLIPLSFFISNFIYEYRVFYYAILALFIAVFTLIGQFLFEDSKLTGWGKKFIVIAVLNTIVLSFVYFTGGLASNFFFTIYFLTFFVAIFSSDEMFAVEVVLLFFTVIFGEVHKYPSAFSMIDQLETRQLINALSLLLSLPIIILVAKFVENLRSKQELLSLSKDVLAVREMEDEALLEEINQGIIILDMKLKIIKISRWVEKHFNISAKFFLGKTIFNMKFYDPVTNQLLQPSDYFFKNLYSEETRKVNWRVLYKNHYGRYEKFIVRQIPLVINDRKIGYLLTMKKPPKNVSELLSTYSQTFSFRLSSSISMIRNLLSMSKQIKSDPLFPSISKHLEFVINLLNDAAIKDEVADGNREIQVSQFDLKKSIRKVIREIDPVRKVAVWNISPVFQTQEVVVNSDRTLVEKMLEYAICGALYFSQDEGVSVSIDEDENLKKLRVMINAPLKKSIDKAGEVLEPFFGGEMDLLSHYSGTGLEISNANLIAKYLGFDFEAGISNNKLIIKILF